MRSVHQGLTIYECEEAFSPQQKKSKIKSKSTKDSGGKKKPTTQMKMLKRL